nr:LuxR family transcriptional regulator [Frankia sp. QA3]
MVLAGAAGVGKTRLAREALAEARERGMIVRWATATASAGKVPLGAFAPLGAAGGDLTNVIRRVVDTAADGESADRDLVVIIDDAHLLDEISASLLYQVVSRQLATVIVTIRTGEPAPDAVTALWKDGYLDRLEVLPLAEKETVLLLEAVLAGPVDSAAARQMWSLAQGNTLYLWQLVAGEREARRLREVRGVWRWHGKPRLSPGLIELVRARMGDLPGLIRETVDLLAVEEPLGLALLGGLTDARAVEEAEERGLATVEADGRRLLVRLAHPLYGEARRSSMGLLRARRLRGRLAVALAGTGARRADDVLRRAVLAVDSDLEPDPHLLTAAARSASSLGDLQLAEKLARAAVNAGGTFDSRLLLGYTLGWLDRGVESDRELAILGELVQDDTERVLVTFARAGNFYWNLHQPDKAEAVLDEADRAIADNSARPVLTSMRAAFHVWLGRPHEAVRHGLDALTYQDLPDESLILASWGVVAGLGVLGRIDEARPVLPRGYAAAGRLGDGPILGMGLRDLHILGLRLAGFLHEAETVARAYHDEHRDSLGPSYLMGIALMGHTALLRGQVETSIRWLREAHAGFTESGSGSGGWELRCLMSLTQALAISGETAAARQALADMEAQWHPGFVLYEPDMTLAKAWVAAVEGATSEAIRIVRTAATAAGDAGLFAWEVLALHTAVRFGDRSVAARLSSLAPRVHGPGAPAAAMHAAALAADDGDALRAASVRLEEAGDRLSAADAAAQAAAAYSRHGHRGAAHAAVTRAVQLAPSSGGRTPALAAVDRTLPLTAREREIVTLAIHGLSNLAIANRLFISVRTVEGHLYRASAKLGASGRAELAALLSGD